MTEHIITNNNMLYNISLPYSMLRSCYTNKCSSIVYQCTNGSCGHCHIIAGVVMLVRAKRVLHHSSQPPPPGTDHYEMVDKVVKRTPLGAGVYEEVDKQDTQTDGHSRHYQELDLTKMERSEYDSLKV